MEQSPSETSFEELKALYQQTYENLRWMVGINTVLIAEAGGVVEIDKNVLEGININAARVEVTFDQERDVYVIEGIYDDAV